MVSRASGKAPVSKELEDAFDSTVEVHSANGEVTNVTSIGSFDPDEDKVEEKPAPKTKAAQAKQNARLADIQKKINQAKSQGSTAKSKADEKTRKLQEQKKAEEQKVRDEAKAKREKEAAERKEAREKKAKDKAAEKERKDKEREAARVLKAKEREQKKLVGKGLTGDPEKDAAFIKVVEESKALAIKPVDQRSLNFSFLRIPGVALSTVGLTLPDNLPLEDWRNAVKGLTGIQDATGFGIGDALNYGEEHYGKQYEVVTEALGLSKQTIKNYKWVSGALPIDVRVEGLPFSHHFEVASFYAENPAMALNILEQAYNEGKSKDWVRQQVNLNRNKPVTAAQRKQDENDAIAQASNAQRQADLAKYGTGPALEQALREELNIFIDHAQRYELVKSEGVIRNLARLQGKIDDLTAERDLWKERYEEVLAELRQRDEAQARVMEVSYSEQDQAKVVEPVAEGESDDVAPQDGVPIVEDDGELSFLTGAKSADDEEPTDEELDAIDRGEV